MMSQSTDHDAIDPEEVLSTIGQRYVVDILDAITETARSAREIAREADVPTTTLYRRLDELVEVGLVEESMQLDGDGDHYSVYRSMLDGLDLTNEGDGVRLSIRVDDGTTERRDDAVSALRAQT